MISDFTNKLSNVSWDTIFNSDDVNAMFKFFLNIYLRIFYSSFPPKRVIKRNIGLIYGSKYLFKDLLFQLPSKKSNKEEHWINLWIKTSCKHKRDLINARVIQSDTSF
jgi:hypothetical protein